MERVPIPRSRRPITKHLVQNEMSELEIGESISEKDFPFLKNFWGEVATDLSQAGCLEFEEVEDESLYRKKFDPRNSGTGSGRCLGVNYRMLTETHHPIKCIIFNAAEKAEKSA